MSAYNAAWISVEVEVQSYGTTDELAQADRTHGGGLNPRRTVKLTLRESFADDAGLDKAVDALAATIREAARR